MNGKIVLPDILNGTLLVYVSNAKAIKEQITTTRAFLLIDMNQRNFCNFLFFRFKLPNFCKDIKNRSKSHFIRNEMIVLTLKHNKNKILANPNKVSANFNSEPCKISFFIRSNMPLLENLMPNRFFNWAKMIMSDVADVKPDVTGVDMKSTKKPKQKFCKLDLFANCSSL